MFLQVCTPTMHRKETYWRLFSVAILAIVLTISWSTNELTTMP